GGIYFPRVPPPLLQVFIAMIKSRFTLLTITATLAAVAAGLLDRRSPAAPTVALPATAHEEETALGEDWVRLRHDNEGKLLALEVAIVRYVPARVLEQRGKKANYQNARDYVDLVGAIHVGDRKYYNQLNKRFRAYDALLYELVAPEGTTIQRGRGTSSAHPLGAVQNGLKSMLEVEHQLEIVDYTRPNFVHADLSPEEFSKSMQDRDESFLQLYFRMAGQAVALQSQQTAQGESADLDFFAALFSKDRPRKLKIAFAKQFESMESLLTSISGPEGSTLITVRNQRALEVLREQQQAGKRRIGIFYGAGHLVDMHQRLLEDFDMAPVGITWLEAWDLRP
ncbi:MAG: hypothetical protein MI725_11465, partial [Pirellulales bacterium]|nr:hypothetical protein [Pirellulales bacterium]